MTTTKPPRTPLAQIDVRDAQATRQLDRILPAVPGARPVRASTFNSAL